MTRWLTKTTAIQATAGRRYSASVWMYGTRMRGSAKLVLTFWNRNGGWLDVAEESNAVGDTKDWRQLGVSATAPAGTAFVRIEFRQGGVGTSWWDDVSLKSGASPLQQAASTAGAPARKQPRAAQAVASPTIAAFRWDGRGFATARTLRKHLEHRGVSWDGFLARHPAAASAFELRAVEWDGRRFFSRTGLRRHLVRSSVGWAAWAARHSKAAEILLDNAVAEAMPRLGPNG